MSDPIPFLSFRAQTPAFRKKVLRAMADVYEGDNFILGKKTEEFEKQYASFTGVSFCAGVGSGLDAISISLKAIGIGPNDEVIVPANTCIPTWMAVSAVGARIVPVEPDIDTYNIDPKKIRAAITKATRAIIPVHLYGQACDMTSIGKIASEHNLAIIEDNAQGHGAEHRGKRTGSFGIINATSFYPTKNLGAIGDGGAITTNDKSLYERVRMLRNYGSREKNLNDEPAGNSRLDELQAAVLTLKLAMLSKWNEQRQLLASIYLKGLKGIGDLMLPATSAGSTHVYHLFVIRTSKRDALRDHLEKLGIHTIIHYPVPPHLQKAYVNSGYRKGSFPVTESISNTVLSLPLWPGMKKAEVNRVISAIRSFYN